MDRARDEGEVLSRINSESVDYLDWLRLQAVSEGDALHLANQRYVDLMKAEGMSVDGLYPQGKGVALTEEEALRRAGRGATS